MTLQIPPEFRACGRDSGVLGTKSRAGTLTLQPGAAGLGGLCGTKRGQDTASVRLSRLCSLVALGSRQRALGRARDSSYLPKWKARSQDEAEMACCEARKPSIVRGGDAVVSLLILPGVHREKWRDF